MVKRQIKASNTATATQFYTELLSKALEYPQFIAPNRQSVHVKNEKFGTSKKEFRRYEAFADLMLTTFGEMKRLGRTDEPLEDYMESWIVPHLPYYQSEYFKTNFEKQLTPKLKQLIANASKRADKGA